MGGFTISGCGAKLLLQGVSLHATLVRLQANYLAKPFQMPNLNANALHYCGILTRLISTINKVVPV